jgi:hypothetical protein
MKYDKREGYNTDLFEIECKKCGSFNVSILENKEDWEGNSNPQPNWYLYCNNCQNSDI